MMLLSRCATLRMLFVRYFIMIYPHVVQLNAECESNVSVLYNRISNHTIDNDLLRQMYNNSLDDVQSLWHNYTLLNNRVTALTQYVHEVSVSVGWMPTNTETK